MGSHINKDGEFQSDKYPTCPAGKVPFSVKDPMAQDLLWEYAERRRSVDAEFSKDLQTCLLNAGYTGSTWTLLEHTFKAGLSEALKVMEARVMEGFLNNPFPSMKPTEVKQTRDDMHAGAIKMFEAVRKRLAA